MPLTALPERTSCFDEEALAMVAPHPFEIRTSPNSIERASYVFAKCVAIPIIFDETLNRFIPLVEDEDERDSRELSPTKITIKHMAVTRCGLIHHKILAFSIQLLPQKGIPFVKEVSEPVFHCSRQVGRRVAEKQAIPANGRRCRESVVDQWVEVRIAGRLFIDPNLQDLCARGSDDGCLVA